MLETMSGYEVWAAAIALIGMFFSMAGTYHLLVARGKRDEEWVSLAIPRVNALRLASLVFFIGLLITRQQTPRLAWIVVSALIVMTVALAGEASRRFGPR